MKKIIINGHGWSGSSALIDLLNSSNSNNYLVVPHEFDDFRTPGSMRNALENNKMPISKRTSNNKILFYYFLRGLIPDCLWPNYKKDKNMSRDLAKKMHRNFSNEKKIFKKFAKLIYRSKDSFEKEKLLKLWFDNLLEYYENSNPRAKAIFIEQFFLFDDQSNLYNWLNFDKLILFIRDPYYQLTSTLESKVLYSNYPWQAQFLIGAGNKFEYRKFQLFLETTRLRYSWIINFLKQYKKEKIIIVDFNDFLYNNKSTIKFISKQLDMEINFKKKEFNILDSQKRNKKWNSDNTNLNCLLKEVKVSYDNFKEELFTNYLSMY